MHKNQAQLTKDLFASNIKHVATIEQKIAQRREALKTFNDKWSCILTCLLLNDI